MRDGLKDETILAEVFVGDRAPTGNTLHTKDGRPIEHPDRLRIIRFNGDLDCSLIHYDSKGNELTDTCHSSVEEAMKQAEFEFAVTPSEWKTP